jgi:hypothetical protein
MTRANKSEQAERRQVLRDTMQSRANAEANEVRGRFAGINKATVVGSEPAPQYPALPEGSWSNQSAAVPEEPPLNADVNWMEPVGENWEVEASIESLAGEQQAPHLLLGGEPVAAPAIGDVGAETPSAPNGAEGGVATGASTGTAPPSTKLKRRLIR